MEQSNDEDRKIFLNHRVAIRIFAEQVQDIVKHFTSTSASMILMSEILNFHKNKYGYQIQPYSLGYSNMVDAIKALPYMEIFESGNDFVVVSRLDDPAFRLRAYAACLCLLDFNKERMPISDFLRSYLAKFKENLTERQMYDMKHAITVSVPRGLEVDSFHFISGVCSFLQIELDKGSQTVTMTPLMKFIFRIIQVLKQKSPMNVFDLKQGLHLSISSCFEFGKFCSFLTFSNTRGWPPSLVQR